VSFTNDMFSGLAQVLATAGVGTYKPTAAYGPTDTAIVSQVLPQAPDAAIGITFYPVSDDATLSDSVVGVQVMTARRTLWPMRSSACSSRCRIRRSLAAFRCRS
jgi:hypothetical protein